MAKKKSTAAQKQSWSNACAFADNLLFHMRRVVPVFFEAVNESERIRASLTVRPGVYRRSSEPERIQHESVLAELKRRVNWDLWGFVDGIVVFERDCKPLLDTVAALYPLGASPIHVWDIRAVSGMETVGRASTSVLIGMFGADLSILELVKTRDVLSTPVRQELLDRVFPYWPGHFYKTWVGRSADELLDLEVVLRREQLHLVGRDPGPAPTADAEDTDLPDVSAKGPPVKPTYPDSVANRAKTLGIDRRTFKAALLAGRYRFQRHSARLISFCDAEPRPAKRGKPVRAQGKKPLRR